MSRTVLLSLFVVGSSLSEGGCIEPILPGEVRANYGWLPIEVATADLRVIRRDDTRDSFRSDPFDGSYANPESDPAQGTIFFSVDSLQGFSVYGADAVRTGRIFGYYRVPGITSLRVLSEVDIEVNNLDDLVTLSTENPSDLQEISRRAGATTFVNPDTRPAIDALPSPEFGSYPRYFECYEPNSRVLIGWGLGYSLDLECYLLE